jgi:anti-sigma B factor antagonist
VLHIRGDVRDRVRVFHLEGTLTTVEVPFLKREVRAAMQEGARDIVLDLAGTEFIDSAGLGAFVALHKATLEAKGRLTLKSPRPNIMALLELTRLHRVLGIETPGPALDRTTLP